MRVLLLLTLLVLAFSNLVALETACHEQYVPDVNNICIRPNYI
jgi:hypothetical protein